MVMKGFSGSAKKGRFGHASFGNDENISLFSSSENGYYGPGNNDELQVCMDWRSIKEQSIRLCATWYSTGIPDEHGGVFAFANDESVFENNVLFYCGVWESSGYSKDVVVKLNGSFYRCISTHTEPTNPIGNTICWELYDVPNNIGSIDATIKKVVAFPDGCDSVMKVDCENGGVITADVGSAYDGKYIEFMYTIQDDTNVKWGWHYFFDPIKLDKLTGLLDVKYDDTKNKIEITTSMTGKYIMEFTRDNYNPTSCSEQARNEFFLTSIANTEYGYANYYRLDEQYLSRWKSGTYTIGITWLDDTNREALWKAINDAVWVLNQKLTETKTYIKFQLLSTSATAENTLGDITITCGSHYDLFEYDASYDGWYNGAWEHTSYDSDGCITGAEIKLRNDGEWHCTFAGVAMEELLQCMGCGYDQIEYSENTLHFEFPYHNKACTISDVDAQILQLLYSSHVENKMTAEQVSVAVNPTNGATVIKNGQTLSFLEPGQTYNIKIYIVDSLGGFSDMAEMTITVPDKQKPELWEWTSPMEGYLTVQSGNLVCPVTAVEWNAFRATINAMREYLGMNAYSFGDDVVQYGTFNYKMYNDARSAIQSMGADAGSLIPEITADTCVTASLFITIRDELNKAIENL